MGQKTGSKVGCLSVKSWARVIAWFEIIFSIIATISIAVGAILFWENEEEGQSNGSWTVGSEVEVEDENSQSSISNALRTLLIMIFVALMTFLNFVFGIILLRGINRPTRSYYLNAWLGFRVIQTFVIVITFYLPLTFYCTTCIVVTVLVLLVALALALFSLYIIRRFTNELRAGEVEDGEDQRWT